MKKLVTAALLALIIFLPAISYAAVQTSWSIINQNTTDHDGDGFSDWKEINLYKTNPNAPDDFSSLPKHIYISLKYQELRYYSGPYLIDEFLVSTGIPGRDTPAGEYRVIAKVPSVLYQGEDYYYPNTKWNLRFLPGYYVHGAFWHSNFGKKMSHGCVNVSYTDVKPLYDWAEVGTPITILEGDFPSNLMMNFPSGSLIQDGQTIYLIVSGKKYGFTSMAAFVGLGYSGFPVHKRSVAGIPDGYVLNRPDMPHIAGSFIINGNTIYYVTENGLIPIPTWEIFLANSNFSRVFVTANLDDMRKPLLDSMQFNDPRLSIK